MTPEEIGRECEKREWSLTPLYSQESHGPLWSVVKLSSKSVIAQAFEAKAAYLDACQREGITPF